MLIANGKQFETARFVSRNFREDITLRIGAGDRTPRTTWVRNIGAHTTHGKWPQSILSGRGKSGGGLANITFWNRDPKYASAHLLIDRDAAVLQTADLITEETYHATSTNPYSIGIEVVQGGDGSIYEDQITTFVYLCDWLTALDVDDKIAIQRMVPLAYTGKVIDRLHDGGRDYCGVFGHRDQTHDRGRGDPGDWLMEALVSAGYERFDLQHEADKAAWKDRQRFIGVSADGVPGRDTRRKLKEKGYEHGQWVRRA